MADREPGQQDESSGSALETDLVEIVHISNSTIDRDPRILRQIEAQRAQGYKVVAIGYGRGINHRPMTLVEKIRQAIIRIPARFFPESILFAIQTYRPSTQGIVAQLHRLRPRLIHLHNPDLLPAGVSYKQTRGNCADPVRLVYDSHEFAQAERLESRVWRLVFPKFIRALEQVGIAQCDAVTCVSPTMAHLLDQAYHKGPKAIVLRNLPVFERSQFRPVQTDHILLHYHGILNSGRRLHDLVRLLALLPDRFQLRITGPVNQPGYDRDLRKLAEKTHCSKRLSINPAVAQNILIQHAAGADMGIYINHNSGPHEQSALPNKIFEYAMAGLMLVAGPAPDLAAFVSENDCGLVAGDEPLNQLAERLASLTFTEIDGYKKAALVAVEKHNWDNEQVILTGLTRTLAGPPLTNTSSHPN